MKKWLKKIFAPVMAVTMLAAAFAPSGAFAETAIKEAPVADGIYSVPVMLRHATSTQESMGNKALRQTAKLEVENGTAELTLSFKSMDFAGMKGYLMEFNRMEDIQFNNANYPIKWTTIPGNALTYYATVDKYNAATSTDDRCRNKKYMKTMSIPAELPEAAKNTTYTWVQVYVPVMGELSQGEQIARLEVDFSNLKQWEEPSVKISNATASLEVGKTVQLTASASGSGDGEMLWSSSDASVAAVSETGTVTAKKAGTAVITAEANNASATCTVTVKEKETPKPVVSAPAIPGNVKAVSTAYNKAKISWNKISGAAGYSVYQYNSKTKKYVMTANSSSTNYTKSGLTCGTTYKFKISAYKMDGSRKLYGAASRVVSVKPVPAAPASVKAKAGKKQAVVSWKKVSGASGYTVYRATKKSGKYKLVKTVGSAKTVKYTNKKLNKGKKYYYKIKAYKKVGKTKIYGNYSKIATVKVR